MRARRLMVACLGATALIACALTAGWLYARGYDFREPIDWLMAQVRTLGPAAFFSLMTFLPAVGAPMTIFTLSAGPLFAPSLGLPAVFALAFLSIGVNLVFTYALARWIIRPPVRRLCDWFGVRLPSVPSSEYCTLVVLMRITPGAPFALQNYILGLSAIPFPAYFAISWILVSLDACVYILFGDAIMQGKGRVVLLSIVLVVLLMVGVRFVRRYLRLRVPSQAGDGRPRGRFT